MKLKIYGQYQQFKREIGLIFDLFKEEEDGLFFCDNSKQLIDNNDVSIEYQIKKDYVEASIKVKIDNRNVSFSTKRTIESLPTEREIKRKTKLVVSYVWLKTLESITGKEHGWGILTGIRPTKLYHKLLLNSSYDEVNEKLEKDYLLKQDKIFILQNIVKRQLKVIPDLYKLDEDVSIYIGIPFCPTKCAYCTFPAYAITRRNQTVEDFLRGLHREIELIGKWLNRTKKKVTTIYFGGGTPTSIEANQLDEIFKKLAQWINFEDVREVTVEAGRPDTITSGKLDILNKWMVDRISINPQSFIQETLDVIGRDHTIEETIQKYRLAQTMNINNINMDLIIGLPGEKLSELETSLNHIEKLKPESLTIHTMAFKKASFLTKNKALFNITNREEIIKMMDYANRWTMDHHYHPYYLYRQKNMLGNLENIGYALENKESLYNIIIMEERQTIIGLGSGAVSKLIPPNSDKVIRFPNPKEPMAYIKSVETLTSKKIAELNKIFQL